MADIFVSYRRNDSQWSAGRINDTLAAAFGAERVFFDTVTIKPGEDFHQVLGNRVGSCRVLLAVIGPTWLDMLEARLGEINDFVRIEIAEGLQRKVRVIPVLIDGAKPPLAARLPDDLKALARLNAIQVRADTFRSDLDQLIGFLREYLDNKPRGGPQGRIKVDAKIIHEAPDGWFKPGAGKAEWFKDHEHGPEMVVVPEGTFLMGSPADEPERESFKKGTESPQRRVTIARPFAVGRHAITRSQFAAFVNSTGHNANGAYIWKGDKFEHDPEGSWHNPGFTQGNDHPVVCVNWEDAKAYAAWLGQVTDRSYRLLSEAEWEYCCRANTTTPFWWGTSITPALANYNGNDLYKGGGSKGEYRKATVSVGSFAANPWGLYQVHGNAWEWCEDVWHDNHITAPLDGSPRLKGGDITRRVVRGGSWSYSPWGLRSAYRDGDTFGNRYIFNGFRLSRSL